MHHGVYFKIAAGALVKPRGFQTVGQASQVSLVRNFVGWKVAQAIQRVSCLYQFTSERKKVQSRSLTFDALKLMIILKAGWKPKDTSHSLSLKKLSEKLLCCLSIYCWQKVPMANSTFFIIIIDLIWFIITLNHLTLDVAFRDVLTFFKEGPTDWKPLAKLLLYNMICIICHYTIACFKSNLQKIWK